MVPTERSRGTPGLPRLRIRRGRDSQLGRDVALKVISDEFSHDSERIQRFEQEARATGTLNHPHVCAVDDVGRHEGSPFVVMEVLDFGLAKPTGEAPAGAGEQSVAPTATGSGVIVGTTTCMAPEQIRGEPVDARADVFALGVVLYELLTGQRPFGAPRRPTS